jgi:hypothetical protein
LQGLQRAGEADLPKKMQDWLNEAYSDVLRFVDPATATENTIRDAFRSYDPVGQQPRMVSLFVGLYRLAGVRAQGRAAPVKSSTVARPRPATARATSRSAISAKHKTPPVPEFSGLHPMLVALLQDLPAPGTGWTQERRDKVAKMFPTVLDFAFPIVEEQEDDEQEGDE